MKNAVRRTVASLARRSPALQRAAWFIARNASTIPAGRDTYGYLRDRFIRNGLDSPYDSKAREDLVEAFERIDRAVPIGSSPTDGLFLAEFLLSLDAPGDLVECGCYAGGSTAKISRVAALRGRRLHVFDSFEGLPETKSDYLRDHHCRRNEEWTTDWTAGRYASRLDEVKKNVAEYGEPSVCTFVKGYFQDTLTQDNLPERIALAFCDVDLADSARECLRGIWPRLSEKGLFVTHDTAYIKVLQELLRRELWETELKAFPPILFGAGFGLCNDSPHLGYMVKGDDLSPDYLKQLTLDK